MFGNFFARLLIMLLLMIAVACTQHKVESQHKVEVAPVEIKPIHITIDVNIKVDKDLDDFFGDIDKAADF